MTDIQKAFPTKPGFGATLQMMRVDTHATALAEKDAEIVRLKSELSGRTFTVDEGQEWMARAGKAEAASATLQSNSRETWQAMQAMRDRINEHIPMPSLESDLLQGPENSIFCATVAESVITAIVALTAERDAALAGAVMVAPLVWVKDYKRDGTPFWQSDWGHVVLARGDNQFLVEHMLFGLRKDALQWAQEQHEARIRAAITADPDALQAVTAAAELAECAGHSLADEIRALTPADALAAQARRDAQMRAQGAASAGLQRHAIAEIRAMDGQTDWDAVRNAGDYDGHDETEPEVAQSDWVMATPTNDAK